MSFYTYILTNQRNTVLYIGITNNLNKRIYEHKNKLVKGFTKKYNVNKLVFYEIFDSPKEAISAEKVIKGWKRERKINLIKKENPNFEELNID